MENKGSKALAFQQPYATWIALGIKEVECRSRKIKTPVKDLIVCASKTASAFYPIPGLPYGYAMALVDVVDCVPFSEEHLDAAMMDEMPEKPSYAWILENARPIKPFPVHASASFFYAPDEIEPVDISDEDAYRGVYQAIWNDVPDEANGLTADDVVRDLFSE